MDILIRRLRYLYQIEAMSETGLKWMRAHYGETDSRWMDRLRFVHGDYIDEIIREMKEDGLAVDD